MIKNKNGRLVYDAFDLRRVRAALAFGALVIGLGAGYVMGDTGLRPASASKPLAWQYRAPNVKTARVEISGQDIVNAEDAVLRRIKDGQPVGVTFGILVCSPSASYAGAESSIVYNPLTYTINRGTDREATLAGYLYVDGSGRLASVFFDPNNPGGPIGVDMPPCYYDPNPLNRPGTPSSGQVIISSSADGYTMINPATGQAYESTVNGPLPIGVHQLVYPSPDDALGQS